jgi:hypothetical protein
MRYTTVRTIKDIRQQASYQFELESIRLGFTVVRKLTNYRYVVRDEQTGNDYNAVILPASFDFYEFRLNLGRRRIDMLIVQRHNAVVPIRVVSLEHVTSFAPLAEPPAIERNQRHRRNHEESMLLVSKLLLNFESAHEALEHMPERTRQRYLERRREYLKPRIGRPWAS